MCTLDIQVLGDIHRLLPSFGGQARPKPNPDETPTAPLDSVSRAFHGEGRLGEVGGVVLAQRLLDAILGSRARSELSRAERRESIAPAISVQVQIGNPQNGGSLCAPSNP